MTARFCTSPQRQVPIQLSFLVNAIELDTRADKGILVALGCGTSNRRPQDKPQAGQAVTGRTAGTTRGQASRVGSSRLGRAREIHAEISRPGISRYQPDRSGTRGGSRRGGEGRDGGQDSGTPEDSLRGRSSAGALRVSTESWSRGQVLTFRSRDGDIDCVKRSDQITGPGGGRGIDDRKALLDGNA